MPFRNTRNGTESVPYRTWPRVALNANDLNHAHHFDEDDTTMRVLTTSLALALILGQAALGLADSTRTATDSSPAPRSSVRDADRVLVVRNENSPVSRAVADDYAQRRAVRNVVSVRCQDCATNQGNETIAYAVYVKNIEKPIRAFLAAHSGIDFIVLTKGIPIRIPDVPGRGLNNTHASLDSYLAALGYDKLPGAVSVHLTDSGIIGTAWANRFWNSTTPFKHAKFGGYLVTRLDGYTEADAKALTTRALAAQRQAGNLAADGKMLLDTCPAFGYADRKGQLRPVTSDSGELNYNEYNADMQRAADLLRRGTCRSS